MYFLHLFHAGGFMMYPLLLCSIIVVAIFFERYRYYSSHRSDTERLSAVMTDSLDRGDIEGLKDALKADGGIRPGFFYLQSMYMELKHIRRQLLKALQHMRQVF